MTNSSSSARRRTPVWVTAALVVLALVLIAVAVVYFSQPADKLPSFFPGHDAHSSRTHTKHGILAAGLAILALIGAWLSTGRTSADPAGPKG